MIPLRASARRITAWIAVAAILLGGLLPALSHALPSADGGQSFVQVCTVAGMKLVAVDASRAGDDESLFLAERCPFCATHHHPAPPLSAAPVFVLPSEGEHFPRPSGRAPRPPFRWTTVAPRGPPSRPLDRAAAAFPEKLRRAAQ